jgi:hypothetical protein
MPRKIFTEESGKMALNDYLAGVPLTEISRKYKCSLGAITSLAFRNGYRALRNPGWTEADIDFLKENYSTLTWDELVKTLGKSKNYIIHKACELGLKREIFFWSAEEITILKENYESKSISEISKILNSKFSESSITTKAYKLGIKKREYWSENELDILRNFYEILPIEEVEKQLPLRTRQNIHKMAKKINLDCPVFYTENEVDFITNNWTTMSDGELAEALNRPVRSVKTKRQNLGFNRYMLSYGAEELREYIHGKNIEWKKKSLQSCGYACLLTGERLDDIHHLFGVNMMIEETLERLNLDLRQHVNEYTEQELESILSVFFEIQSHHPLGVCLKKEIHRTFHNIYGFGNNTPEQFYEFRNNYENGIIKIA